MSPIEAKFLRWIRRVKRGGGGRLVLGHVDVAGRGAQLGVGPVRAVDAGEALEQVTLDVMQVATDDTDGQAAHSPQQYLALYYTEGAPQEAYSRFKFRLAPPQSDFAEGQSISSEPPSESGLVAQAMRFLEMGQRASWGGMGAVIQTMQHQLQRADERDARHEERHERRDGRYFALMDKLEAAHTEEHLRETATMAAHHEAEDRRAFHSNITLLGSSLLTKLSGSSTPLLPEQASPARSPGPQEAPDEAPSSTGARVTEPAPGVDPMLLQHVQTLVQSITPEQMQGIQGVLRMEQMIALATLYNAVMPAADGPAGASSPSGPTEEAVSETPA